MVTATESSLELFAHTLSSPVEHKHLAGKGRIVVILFPWALNRVRHLHGGSVIVTELHRPPGRTGQESPGALP